MKHLKQETQPIKSNATAEGMQLLEGDLTAISGKLLAEDFVYFSDGTMLGNASAFPNIRFEQNNSN